MTRFKTEKAFEDFCDTSMWCICGKLMTGLHMISCQRVRAQRERLKKKVKK